METSSDWGWGWGKIAKVLVLIVIIALVTVAVGYCCFLGYEWTQRQRACKQRAGTRPTKHVSTRRARAMSYSRARRGATSERVETDNRQAPKKKRVNRRRHRSTTSASTNSRSRSQSKNNKKKRRIKRKRIIELRSGTLDDFSRFGSPTRH